MLENLVGENKALREHPDVVLYQNMILTRGDIATLATHTVRSQVWSYYSHAESSWTFFSGPVCFPVWMCAVSFWNHLSDMIHCLGYVTEDLNSRAYTPLSSILALFTLFDTSIECVRFKMVTYLHSWLLSFQALKGSVSVIAFGRLRERESGYSAVSKISASLGRKGATGRSRYLAKYITISMFYYTYNWHHSKHWRKRKRKERQKRMFWIWTTWRL